MAQLSIDVNHKVTFLSTAEQLILERIQQMSQSLENLTDKVSAMANAVDLAIVAIEALRTELANSNNDAELDGLAAALDNATSRLSAAVNPPAPAPEPVV